MPCDSRASEPGGGDLWGLLAERLECARERPFSFVTLRCSLTDKYGQFRPVAKEQQRFFLKKNLSHLSRS